MKLRIRANSIRLRLGQTEVRRLVDEGQVDERTHFAPGGPVLAYGLRSVDSPVVSASFDGGNLVVAVPQSLARQWADTDQVGIEAAQPTGPGGTLRILIEKDFECLDADGGERQDDAFPNPRGANC